MEKKIFKEFLPYKEVAAILAMWPNNFVKSLASLS